MPGDRTALADFLTILAIAGAAGILGLYLYRFSDLVMLALRLLGLA